MVNDGVMLSAEHLRVTLNGRPVVADVSADFAPGELTGIVGPNGAGKSTLVRAMLSLVPFEGRVLVDGKEHLARAERARRIAYLPQGQSLHWPLTVERLVGLGRLPHLGPMSRLSDADTAAIEAAMARADVATLRGRDATGLSGGELARALLARALAVEAPVLIADEPLASLDPGHQIDVMELLRAEARDGGTVIAVLHDLGMAARYCDRLLLIDEGRIVADGPPTDVLTSANLRRVYGVEADVTLGGAWPVITILGRGRG